MKGFPFFVLSFLFLVGTVVVGVFHMEERGYMYYFVLLLALSLFLVASANVTFAAIRDLLKDYKKQGNILGFLYDFFASLKLAIFLMLTIGIVSMLGSTYIQQNQPIGFYLDRYGADIGLWIWKLWLNDVFHSWYYILLIVLLAINLTVCSIKRLPSVWKHSFGKERFLKLDEKMERHMRPLLVYPKTDITEDMLVKFVKKEGFKVFVNKEENTLYLYGEKGRFSRLGVFVVHIALLVIMAGGLLDALMGVRGNLTVAEGSREDRLVIPGKDKVLKLPFQIHLESFHIVTYEEEAKREGRVFRGDPSIKDAVASYESNIKIVQGGQVVAQGITAVNNPFRYGPYRIFQASYGLTGEAGEVLLTVYDRQKLFQERDPQTAFLGTVKLKAGQVGDFRGMLLSIDRSTLNIENEQAGFNGEFKPAIILKVIKDHRSYDVPVIYSPELTIFAYSQIPQLKDFPYIFFMEEFKPRFFSGFQITYSPGMWVIWTGSALLVLGLILAFYTVHRKVWIKYQAGILKVAFWSHKFKEEYRKSMILKLKELGDVEETS